MHCFIPLFICWMTFLVNFKNGSESLTRKTAQVCIPLMRFLLQSLVLKCFILLLYFCYTILLFTLFVINFRFNINDPYGLVLCCYKERINFSLKVFSFQLFSCNIPPVCCLKYQYSYFSSLVCLLVFIVVLVILMLSVLSPTNVINLSFYVIFQVLVLMHPLYV